MKNNLLLNFLFTGIISFVALAGQCQSDKFAYAVTDEVRDGVKWNYLRNIDLRTGSFSNILTRLLNDNDMLPVPNTTPYNGVAAIAYDKENKRLYYTPMLIDRLSYIDLKTMRTYIVTNKFTGLTPKTPDQGNIFTRMVIAVDENGYALTNDGRHFIRFKTDKKSTIIDLGSLVDAPGNNEMSVHNACSSFGGDIIADDEGHLYLFSSRNHVFRINIKTKVAKYLGTVNGLPANFTTSGVAVNNQNKIVLISAVDASDIYTVDINTLVASKLNANNPWHTSDLANSNILRTSNNNNRSGVEMIVSSGVYLRNDSIQLFPNPVTSGEFKIQFAGIKPGKYTVDVIDAKGQVVVRKIMDAGGKTYFSTIILPGIISKGLFVVRITDQNNKALFNDKIIVQ
jgi:hypothetical protein